MNPIGLLKSKELGSGIVKHKLKALNEEIEVIKASAKFANEESKSHKYNIFSQVVHKLIQVDKSLVKEYLSLIESRKDIRSFGYREKLFESFFSMEKVYGIIDGRSIRNFFIEDVKRDGTVALKIWVTAVENGEIVRKLYNTEY
jgi:hypothetical protein